MHIISNEASTVLLRTSIIYTDSFLLISGVLTSYSLSREISQKGKISWTKKFIARYIRLTPALFAVVLFYAYLWDHLGSGPMWNTLVKKNAELCQRYLWRNLLYIQNFFAFENMCAPQTHQLALDMQLSLLAPLFIHVLYRYDKVGIGILQALFLLSSIMRYISTANNNLSVVIYHGMPVSQLYRTANMLYGQTLHRASPYLMGTIIGYYLKKYERRFDVPKAFAALGWIIAFSLGFYSIVSPSNLAQKGYQYDVREAAQYAASIPVAWSFALAWLIVACHLGCGGKLNEFLCNKSLLVFSRISYSIYLTQFLVFFYRVGVKRIPEIFTFSGSFNVIELCTVIAVSIIVTLLFDFPMTEIKRIILDKKSPPSIIISIEETLPERKEREEVQDSRAEDNIPRKEFQESQEILEEMDYPEEEIEEDRGGEEEVDEEMDEDADEEVDDEIDEEDDEEADEEDDEEADEEDEEEVDEERDDEIAEEDFEMQPLRRSTRIHFDEESEDADWLKIEKEDEE